jgi:hypothetical protein
MKLAEKLATMLALAAFVSMTSPIGNAEAASLAGRSVKMAVWLY